LEHKNAGNVTDLDLYDGFVWIEKDGRAASMYYGKKVLWNVVTDVEAVDKWHQYTKVCYAMLTATYDIDDQVNLDIMVPKISVQPDGESKPFLIDTVYSDTGHHIINKLRDLYERTRSYASKNNNG